MKNLFFGLVVIAVASMAHSADEGHFSKGAAKDAVMIASAAYDMCIHYGEGFLYCMDGVNVMLDKHVENVAEIMEGIKTLEKELESKDCPGDSACVEGKLHSLKTILHDVTKIAQHVCLFETKHKCFKDVFSYYVEHGGYHNIQAAIEDESGESGEKSDEVTKKPEKRDKSLRQLFRDYIERESK